MQVASQTSKTNTSTVISTFAPTMTHINLRIPFLQRYSRLWMSSLLVLTDLVSLFVAGILAALIGAALGGGLKDQNYYLRMVPIVVFFIIVYAGRGLYPSVGVSPVEELKRLTVSTSFVFLVITAMTFWIRNAESYSRLMIAFSWLFALIFIQVNRWILRYIAIRFDLWGEPVAFVGYGPQGRQMADFLLRNLKFGLRPVVILDGFYENKGIVSPLPKIKLGNSPREIMTFKEAGIRTVILVTSEMPDGLQAEILHEERFGFERVILISDLQWIGSVGVIPYDLQGYLGLEVQRNLVRNWEQGLKRLLDLFLVIIGGLLVLPLFGLIAAMVWLESKGQVFYTQNRIGKNGRIIKVWKFRTMVPNADQVLDDYLTSNPDLLDEWQSTHKIKDDPRVTKLGSFLRRYSLDELPQLWNVIKGEMSIVGPRPIVDEEIRHYGHCFHMYKTVLPGITGLWQISGRNDVSYALRVRLDEYYVRNWSIWLDIYILIRTVWVVLNKEGAY